MEFITAIPLIGPALGWVLPFLIVLGIVVFIHELGHYLVGRWCGIHAEVFSIGFGKPIWGRTDKRGTYWQVACLPLGGYVKFVGDMNPASAGGVSDDELSPDDRDRAFHNSPLWARTLTVAAGPVFNFALSILVFAGLIFAIGQPSDEPVVGSVAQDAPADIGFMTGDTVLSVGDETVSTWGAAIGALTERSGAPIPVLVDRGGVQVNILSGFNPTATVSFATPGKPASRAGIRQGDIIVSINGTPVKNFWQLQIAVADAPLREDVTIVVERERELLTFSFLPELQHREHPRTNEKTLVPTIGIQTDDRNGLSAARAPVPATDALTHGVLQTWSVLNHTVNFLEDMIFANADVKQLGGPIRIAEFSSRGAKRGLQYFVQLIALISASIGLLNLFPIPVLDGGHLLFYLVEAVRGKPVGETATKIGTMIGLSLVLLLMVFATYNDLDRLLS